MKKWLTILFLFAVKASYCQTVFYIKAIDSLIVLTDKSNLNFCADSIYQPTGNNSLFLKAASVEFFFADNKAKNLVKVDETTRTAGDTTHIIYYFHEKRVVKIVAHREKKHFSVDQVFYFNNNKIVYPQSFDNSPFGNLHLMERAKLYLKFNAKSHRQLIHSCDE